MPHLGFIAASEILAAVPNSENILPNAQKFVWLQSSEVKASGEELLNKSDTSVSPTLI